MVHGQEVTDGEQASGNSTRLLVSPPNESPRPGKHGFSALVKGLFWGAGFTGTTLLSAAVGTAIALYTPISKVVLPFLPGSLESLREDGLSQLGTYSLGRPVNILIMGIDRVVGAENTETAFGGRSDTMLLMRFDPNQAKVNMLSIPRDSQVQIPEVGLTKVNEANVYGGGKLAAQVVSANLNGVTVDRYVRVTTDTFKELVDAVGGVNVFVPNDMQYQDQTQGLDINLSKGWQVLNGDQAEQFARFRHDEYGDIGRVQRQQVLLKALREKVQSPSIIPRLPALIGLIKDHIDTNLNWEEMLALMNFSRQLGHDGFNMVMLPGRFSEEGEFNRSYWIIANQGKNQVMEKFFGVEQPVESFGEQTTTVPLENLRIAIQNASGTTGVAKELSQLLGHQNFSNTYLTSDYSEVLEETQIIAQKGDLETAYRLLDIIGTGHVEASSTGDLESDFTIRIGKDWLKKSN